MKLLGITLYIFYLFAKVITRRTNKKFRHLIKEGEACTKLGECASGLECNLNHATPRCLKKDGQKCEWDYQCIGYHSGVSACKQLEDDPHKICWNIDEFRKHKHPHFMKPCEPGFFTNPCSKLDKAGPLECNSTKKVCLLASNVYCAKDAECNSGECRNTVALTGIGISHRICI